MQERADKLNIPAKKVYASDNEIHFTCLEIKSYLITSRLKTLHESRLTAWSLILKCYHIL